MKISLNFIKLKIIPFVVFSLLSFYGCPKSDVAPEPLPTNLNLTITEHPDGGKRVNQVLAKFEGTITGTVTPVSVTVEWWWEDVNHDNSKMVESEEIIFNSDNVTIKSTIYKAQTGYILMNYYWAKFIWTDDNGQHETETSKAFCTSK